MKNIAAENELWLILLIVILFSTLAIGMCWVFTGSRYRSTMLSFEGMVPPFFSLPAVLFSLIAALLATSIWENYTIATKSIRNESQGILNVISLANSLPQIKNVDLTENALRYTKSIIQDEWPTLSINGIHSAETQMRFEALRAALFQAANQMKNTAESEALISALQSINSARETRLGFVSFDVHPARWFAMLFLAVLVQVTVAFVHVAKPKALLGAQLIATLTVLVPICMIALTFSSPYEGIVAISNSPYLEILK